MCRKILCAWYFTWNEECNAKLLYCSISKHPIPDIGEQMGATLDGWSDIAVAVLFMIPELEVKEVEKDTRSLRQSRRINVGLTCSEAYVSSQDGRDLIGGFESLTLIIPRYFQNNLSRLKSTILTDFVNSFEKF